MEHEELTEEQIPVQFEDEIGWYCSYLTWHPDRVAIACQKMADTIGTDVAG
jgi:hypothetical protein